MKNIFIALGLLMILASCSKELDQDPVTSKDVSVFLRDETEVEEYVNAAYANLQYSGLYGLYMPALSEIPSDNTFDEVPLNDGGMYGELDLFNTIASNDIIATNWKDSYKGIQKANIVLNRIGNIPYRVDSVKRARAGEMRFIRALLYFNLVRLYGDVPLVIKETTDVNAYFGQGRTPLATVYDQIKKDLTEAVDSLPANTTQPGKVIKTAAQALLGKVYLTLKDYPNAKKYLAAVVESKKHGLLTNTNDIFLPANENSKEIIFSVQFSSGINGNSEGSSMYQQFSPSATVSGAKGHNLPVRQLYNMYTATDTRKTAYVGLASTGIPFCNKLKKPATVIADGGSDFVILRYADVLLMLAEVENESNNLKPAGDYLNEVRNRAGLLNTTAADITEMRAAIDLERKLELIGEGHRWFDLLRTGTAITVMNAWFSNSGVPITIDQHHLLFPIPIGQINTDPSIKQNPGYH
ncbi:RagB/SusD family nutrient uptake outer membrane protein [Chitinophaga sp. SYP-B3965]|uniref:RagB/SusD family nutrient uptake outer membrane protein n=1 Tax=Chitinophaga sp. SYP-B3965 TaxID=2663120 RepID=UPI0012995FE2|nr:RagB/SusD family nutrient uptake outer membrane protein [Chitinophaga sp. SYP-B3965]MRG45169.1 RagB/SusD family nutrient uptake outer membrane protein [Chitinophaga sp. SYP-B3965]